MTSPEEPIYLDHNATTPVLPEVLEAMLPYLRQHYGNPSSDHAYGRAARRAVESARAQVARLIGAAPHEIVFTSGGTEANNLAIRGVTATHPTSRRVITSTIEHPATREPCQALESLGWHVTWLPVDADGRIHRDELNAALQHGAALVTLMHANNETGTLQPIAEVAQAAHHAGALLHTDAAQSAGKIPVHVDDLHVDLLSVAGHKLYAPKGIGALYVREGTSLEPFVRGAGHERGLRPGTENVAAIVALGAASDLARISLEVEANRLQRLRDLLWQELEQAIPGLAVNGHPTQRLPNTLNILFPNASGSDILAHAPAVAASTGSACHEGDQRPSPVLTAMSIDPQAALGAIRLSLGRATTEQHIHTAAQALARAWRKATAN